MRNALQVGTAIAIALVIMGATTATPVPHFGLASSSPEAGSTVPAPSEVRLSFTEEPQEGTVRISIVEAEAAGVHVMDAAQDDEDSRVFTVVLHGTLPAGTYTVSWRGMGADGHVVRDTFQFAVSTP